MSKNKFTHWMKHSITARMLVVGILLLVLLIPLESVKRLIEERAWRQQEVVGEIHEKWGGPLLLSGPVLQVPYRTYKEVKTFDEKTQTRMVTQEEIIKTAYFFPDLLNIDSEVDTKKLHRSIYESVVYEAGMAISGRFPKVDFAKAEIDSDKDVLWEKASLLVELSNLKGIRNNVVISFGGREISMMPQYTSGSLHTLKSETPLDLTEIQASENDFSFRLDVNGSQRLQFIPIGKETNISMQSNWPAPSFDGMFLPDDNRKKIDKDGFSAAWKVLQINRQFEQSFFGPKPVLDNFAFGTSLIVPIDEYQKNERTAKYGLMVIGLTLLVFLLIQLVSKIYIHPFQYVMIGLALVMFYTLLISISEHSSFTQAYLLAGAAVLTLITLYSRAVLKGFKFPLLVCGSLSLLYGFIFVIIQLESHALLVGSIGMFAILAAVMFASRRIDWNNEG